MATPRYQIIEARHEHVWRLAGCLRDEDRAFAAAAGFAPRDLLFRMWRDSPYRRVAIIDGQVAALWGCYGMLLSPVGEAWLMTGPEIERLPIAFVREARRELAAILESKTELVMAVDARSERAKRFLQMLGFQLEPPRSSCLTGKLLCPARIARGGGAVSPPQHLGGGKVAA